MKRILAVAAATLGLLVGAGQAAAESGDPAAQAAGQAASSGQAAGTLSGASQSQPTNQNISVRVLSPGSSGDVSQSNTVASDATAANANLTGQSADQTQSGPCGCEGGTQAIGQEADSSQAAQALSVAKQDGASNTNIPVRVLSPGNDGDVSQTNSVESDATAANLNATGQDADQAAGGSGTQAIAQDADSEQEAAAASAAEQSGATNTNISVRVLSPGDDGSVEQSNSVDSSAKAANLNLTGQDADQTQGGSGGTQAIGQDADNAQSAGALSAARQNGASNTNTPVRVLSPGAGGNVSQSSSVASSATAANLNGLEQGASQSQAGGCGCGSGGIQAIGQDAANTQSAAALSGASQSGASNTNAPVRVGSDGDDGNVSQSNSVGSSAAAGNLNLTGQGAGQGQGGSGGTQAIGQSASNDQTAIALSAAPQYGASNSNSPVRVASDGDGGKVTQSNDVSSSATAANLNGLEQGASQAQRGGDCRCGSNGIQAIGQNASNTQGALAGSLAVQAPGRDECGCSSGGNTNAPVRVDSEGDGGWVDQSNDVSSSATAANLNGLGQGASQAQGGSGGIQAIGQSASNDQTAIGLSAALQYGASNSNSPVRVASDGDGGKVSQSSSVESDATALNVNLTGQGAEQVQSGGCGCASGIGIQAIGQQATSVQGAAALSFALQDGASNDNSPVRVASDGNGGSVEQSNDVSSSATAANLNGLGQYASQAQGGGGGIAIQAVGQSASNAQEALALSGAFQLGASNSNSPVAVASDGDGGDVSQSNSVDSDAKALNVNLTGQAARQIQSGGCGCAGGIGIQAIGQEAKNEQGALAASLAIQAFGRDTCGCLSGGNSNTPVGVGSHGSGGSTNQSNSVGSSATAANLNGLGQGASQAQGGGGGIAIQAIGQSAKNRQAAAALSAALQLGARNGRWLDN
ncbi:MAG: hypothetical protein MSC30_02330 [Gaiellaceae bacterium MAG52_C11]|nr:hypothetical protein [Candidatus Gaiellasilicea maunaloa]